MIDRQIKAHAVRGLFRYTATVVFGLALWCDAASMRAQTIVDSQGFEAPLFTTTFNTTGQLEGQTPATFNGTWLRTKGAGSSTAVIQTAVVESGSQAVRVDRIGNSNDRWGIPVSGYPAGDYICISWDMRVDQTTGPAGTFGPFFGAEAYDDDGTAIGLLASLGVDATTGDVLYQAPDTGFLTETGVLVNFGQWNNFMIDLDYANHVASYYVNSTPLGTFGFVDQNNVAGGLDEFTDADISALAAAGGASESLGGTAYYDNFTVVEGLCIPEPTGAALAVAGLAAIMARRRTMC
ncbi:MAG: hypothetical protein IT424_12395 [Pirellulales bacterium]|nr:hypothetical protein [Pirellulales bacterium]